MRAVDAASASPKIGSNIGAGPDVLAATLAGDPGMEILDASVAALKSTRRAASHAVANRLMAFGARWVAAFDGGCRQFVILAAGLDARAWRMPRPDASAQVFEPRDHPPR